MTDLPPPPPPAIIQVDAAFPGGNILVNRIDGDTLYVKQDLRDTEGWWFHWAFQLHGAEGHTIKVQFEDNGPVGTRGPAMSLDGGWTWAWQSENFGKNRFSVAIPTNTTEVLLAFADLYTQRHWERFVERMGPSPYFVTNTLTTSRKGRAVEMARVGCVSGSPEQRVFVSARHHACESMASYVLEGLIEGVLAENDEALWLRNNVEFLMVPFVDKDGVEEGDQGKSRRPHDHNRDYGGESIYPETAAIRELVPRWSGGKLVAGIDLHCPYLRGNYNEFVYQVGRREAGFWAEQQRLGSILERVQSGALDYRNADNLAFGKLWNTGTATGTLSCSKWFATLPSVKLATSFEIAYATAHDRVVTAESARAFGRDLARALAVYLREGDPTP